MHFVFDTYLLSGLGILNIQSRGLHSARTVNEELDDN